MEIDSWRWAGVPFLIRTGKHLPVTAPEAIVEFNAPPRLLFTPEGPQPPHPNHLRFPLGKADGLLPQLQTKAPHPELAPPHVHTHVPLSNVFLSAPGGHGPRP